jgi:hypothetical protein
MTLIPLLWQRLQMIKHLTVQADWRGRGDVCVSRVEEHSLIFREQGYWENGIHFKNNLLWTLDTHAERIALAHLRFEHPIFLCHLVAIEDNRCSSLEAHHCGQDRYRADLLWNQDCVHLRWHVTGPKKTGSIDYFYQ